MLLFYVCSHKAVCAIRYDWNSIQQDLYDETANPIVQDVLEGFNGTIFAYGQTGTGKTFTMEGVRKVPELRGIIPNSFEHIFNEIGRTEGKQYLVRCIYVIDAVLMLDSVFMLDIGTAAIWWS